MLQTFLSNLKGLSGIQTGGKGSLIRSVLIKWRPRKFFFNFNDTSHDRSIKPFTSDLRITEMAFSIQKMEKFLTIPAYDKTELFVPGKWL
jgi:hypothetical protein